MEKLRDIAQQTLEYVAESLDATAGDHLEALGLLRALRDHTPEDQRAGSLTHLESYETGQRDRYMRSGQYRTLDRDRRTRAADLLRAARDVVLALCPPSPVEP